MVKLVTEDGEKFDVSEDFVNIASFIKEIQDIEGVKEEFVLNTINKEDLANVLTASKIVNYQFKEVTKVNSEDARFYLGEELTAFLKTLGSKKLNELYRAASKLRIKGLSNNIATFIATSVYVKLTPEYQKKRAELGLTDGLTPERTKMLIEKYPFLS